MNILYYNMGSFLVGDIVYYLQKSGHSVDVFTYKFEDRYVDDTFCEVFYKKLKEGNYDRVISSNFFPLTAKICNDLGIPYIAWTYDSPIEQGFDRFFDFDTNIIFLFDREEAEAYQKRGFKNIFHLPLAVNTDRLDSIRYTAADKKKYAAEISFVGNLYESSLDVLTYSADEYVKGYIECMIQAQIGLYGCYLLEDMVTDKVLNKLNDSFKEVGQTKYKLNKRGLAYEIAREVTNFERTTLLSVLAEKHKVKFYSKDHGGIENVEHCGIVLYKEEMPAVFRYSKLNLNPTLRCIRSGIPLRALDIMGSGGVLLSNYQSELTEYFCDGENIIMYCSLEEAVEKADYYLKHEDLLPQIAAKGKELVEKYFGFEDRIKILTK